MKSKHAIPHQKYEISIARLFAELNVPTICRDLIRVFIGLGKGKPNFEASHQDIGKALFGDSVKKADAKNRVKHRMKRLYAWQAANRVELVRLLETGHKVVGENDITHFVKSQFEFVLLAAAVVALDEDDENGFALAIEEAIETGKQGCDVAEVPMTHIRNQIGRDKLTIVTKVRRMFEQATAIGMDEPFEYCRHALQLAEEELHRLNEQAKEEKSLRDRFDSLQRSPEGFLEKLQRAKQPKELFSLGEIFITPGASEALQESNQTADAFLSRHHKGDWGDVCKADWSENEFSVSEGFRILSSYKTNKGEKLWIISEADRTSTTVLLPSEY